MSEGDSAAAVAGQTEKQSGLVPTSQPQITSTSNPSPDDIRRQVEAEQALTESSKRLQELQDQLEKIKAEKDALQYEKQTAGKSSSPGSQSSQLRTELSALQSSFHNVSSELRVLEIRVEAAGREKGELLEEAERLQQRFNRGNQELFTLRSQRQETSQKLAHLDVEVSELRMAAESSKFNEQRSIQALQNARKEVLQLNKTSADVEERFGKYRADKQAEMSELQMEYDKVFASQTSTDNSYQSLQRTFADQSRRLAEAHSNIATLTSAAASRKASTSSEMARLMEENRVLEKRAEEARATINEREAELEKIVDAAGETSKIWEDKWKKEERLHREAEKRSEDLTLVVERLAMAGGEGTELSPTMALAGGLRQSGKSYTSIYTDYTLQEGKLSAAENEVDRLTQLLDEISADISEKKPLLDEQAAEHARAIERANALASELASVISTRDAREADVKSLNAAAALQKDEVSSLQTTTADLYRQVQGLLRQIAIKGDSSLSDYPLDGTAQVDSETGDIITDHFVEFRSIRSLQEQNQKLLRLTRGLMQKLEMQQIDQAGTDADDIDTGASLDQATQTISQLHAQLLEAQKKINEATRERDFFSKLLARGEGLKWVDTNGGPLENGSTPHEQAITSLQVEIDTIRIKADQEVSEARELMRRKSDEAGHADVGRARAEAQVTLLQEQVRMTNDAAALQKQEMANVETQMRQLQGSISVANTERRSALEQVASRQAEADRLRNDVANLRAEKEQLAGTETRLQADFRIVQSERARLQQLIDNLQNINDEHEKTRADEKARLEKRVEEVQREMTTLRTQLENAREATASAEKRANDIQPQIDAATATVRAEKEAAETLVQARTKEITDLQSKLDAAKEDSTSKLRIGLRHQQRANELLAEKKRVDESLATKDQEFAQLNERMSGLSNELVEVKNKVGEAERKLADSERGSQLKDSTVSRLESELSQARVATGNTSGDSAALTGLRTERDSLQQKLAQAEKDIAEAKFAGSSTDTTVTSGDATSEAEVTAMRARIEDMEKAQATYDSRYEEGVSKVNRVNASLNSRVRDLSAAQARIPDLEKQIADLKAAATASSATGDQSNVEEAVKAAVTARETQLNAEHAKQLEEARSSAPVTGVKDEPMDGTTAKPDTDAAFDQRLAEAVSARTAELEKERNQLRGKVEVLEQKIKVLERNIRTTEIGRKLAEKQLESALKKSDVTASDVGGEAPASPAPTTAASAAPVSTSPAQPTASTAVPALSAAASPFAPTPGAASTSANASSSPSVNTPTGPAAGTSTAVRGAGIRGRGRGAGRGGRGGKANSVLSAVNATLAQNQPSTTAPAVTATAMPTSPNPNKRSLPTEEGEISEDSQAVSLGGDAAAGGAGGGRTLKRRRDLGPSGPKQPAAGQSTGGASEPAGPTTDGSGEAGVDTAADSAGGAPDNGGVTAGSGSGDTAAETGDGDGQTGGS